MSTNKVLNLAGGQIEWNRSWRRAKYIRVMTTRRCPWVRVHAPGFLWGTSAVLAACLPFLLFLSFLPSLIFHPEPSFAPSNSFFLFIFFLLSCSFPRTSLPSSLLLFLPVLSFSFPKSSLLFIFFPFSSHTSSSVSFLPPHLRSVSLSADVCCKVSVWSAQGYEDEQDLNVR